MEHRKRNTILCVESPLCPMRERISSNVYDIEEIVEADLVLKNVTILDVDHVVEAVVADNPIVYEEIIELGLPCMSISPLRQAIIPASPGFLAFELVKFDALIKKHNNLSEKNAAWAQNQFNTWREIIGLDSNIPIEDLSFVVLSDFLCKFDSIVCKLN